MPAALVVRWRTEAAQRRGFQFDPFEKAVERQIEIEPRLFAVGNDVKPCFELVVNCDQDGVFDQFLAVGFAELVQVPAGEFEPTGKRVAADHCRSEGRVRHEAGGMRDEG